MENCNIHSVIINKCDVHNYAIFISKRGNTVYEYSRTLRQMIWSGVNLIRIITLVLKIAKCIYFQHCQASIRFY